MPAAVCNNGDGTTTIADACDTLYGALNPAAGSDPFNPLLTCSGIIAYNATTGEAYDLCQNTILGSGGVCIAKGSVNADASIAADTVCYYAQLMESDPDVLDGTITIPQECKNQQDICSCASQGAFGAEAARLSDAEHAGLATTYSVDLPWAPVPFDVTCYAEREWCEGNAWCDRVAHPFM